MFFAQFDQPFVNPSLAQFAVVEHFNVNAFHGLQLMDDIEPVPGPHPLVVVRVVSQILHFAQNITGDNDRTG